MGSRFDSKDYRDGWFAGRRKETKRRLLWVLIGFFLREIALFLVWTLFRP